MLHSILLADAKPVEGSFWIVALIISIVVVFFGLFLPMITRFKRCPSNRILVIYGKVGGGNTAKCVHGGMAFVVPLFQDYAYLSLEPMQIEIPLKDALSMENIRVNVPSIFTVAIGTDSEIMQNAAIRLLGLMLINVNITDITDESGYIEAIGRKAASQAIQQANVDVAEQEKLGQVGVAEAAREKAIQV